MRVEFKNFKNPGESGGASRGFTMGSGQGAGRRGAMKAGKKVFSGMSHKKSNALIILITVLLAAVLFYRWLPAVNIKNRGFWSYLLIISGAASLLFYLRHAAENTSRIPMTRKAKIPLYITGGLFVLPIILSFLLSAKLLYARSYSSILTVKEGTVDDIPSVHGTDSIALMDTNSAAMLGDREIGTLSDVVSQYNVSSYTQIDSQGKPVKVAPLKYAGFFKWYRNRSKGIPGYVLVDPVKMRADYQPLSAGMRYVPSAYFGENLTRKIRFHFPTKMFGNIHFEIDEEGNPYYIASVYDHLIGLFGGEQVIGAILVDPVTGSMEYRKTGDIPRWVDVVYPGDLICAQYNNYAQLQKGYWNSIFGQTGCRKVTEYADGEDGAISDYGYVAKDGDIWIYTGVTSLNNDSSNLGFILSNERTEETIYITCAGADEFSAMAAAEGEVQEKRYQASFPSLIQIDEKPAYIMVLKDNSGLVKMYACVNVEQYNIVATASTQKDCISKYTALLSGKITQAEATAEAVPEESAERDTSGYEEKTITVKKRESIVENGDTYLYIVDENGTIYKAKYADVVPMMLVEDGAEITILTDGEWYLLP